MTHAQLLEIVNYAPETGLFTLLQATARRPAGAVMNNNFMKEETRATKVCVPGMGAYGAGRLAWFYVTGEWPPAEVDHRDNDGWNQRWLNLREATRSQNQANTRCYRSNKFGLKGVHFSKDRGLYRAMIQKDKQRISLGSFKDEASAAAAYAAAAANLHGEFARL